jgi:hypothetical protein
VRRRHPQTGSQERARRLIAALVVLCLAPLGLLTWFSLSLSAEAVRGQVDARVQNTASASAVYVKDQMDGLAELVGSYAQRPSMVQAMRRPGTGANAASIAFHLKELQRARRGSPSPSPPSRTAGWSTSSPPPRPSSARTSASGTGTRV